MTLQKSSDNCPDDANSGQADTDGDGVGDVCDNCQDKPNGPHLGTCIAGRRGEPCTSDNTCNDGETEGVCIMDQTDSDDDQLGDVCDNCPDDHKLYASCSSVLNAPYRGTITSLRAACADMPYGEIRNHIEPDCGTCSVNEASTMSIWVRQGGSLADWDRSVLRFYNSLDASAKSDGSSNEIDLTGHTSENTAYEIQNPGSFQQFSFKAIGTKTLAPQTFQVVFKYQLANGDWHTPTQTVLVVPVTGSFTGLPGESEAFHYGTPVLDVTVGAASLRVPIGRKAEDIGAAYVDYRFAGPGDSQIAASNLLLPSAAEAVYAPQFSQFRLDSAGSYAKSDWGTPTTTPAVRRDRHAWPTREPRRPRRTRIQPSTASSIPVTTATGEW